MKMVKRNFSRSLLPLLLLAWTSAVSAQQDQRSVAYGFVSPNTSQNLKLEQAIKGMSSREETELRRKAINLSCVVRTKVEAVPTIVEADVELVFDPPWNQTMMSDAARLETGMF